MLCQKNLTLLQASDLSLMIKIPHFKYDLLMEDPFSTVIRKVPPVMTEH